MGIINQYDNKKYRINEMLDKLPGPEYRLAIKILPDELGVSIATFGNYRAIKLGEKQDVPHEVIAKLEQFFGVGPGELRNYDIEIKPIAFRSPLKTKELAADLGLSK
jgi:hypothetical protein